MFLRSIASLIETVLPWSSGWPLLHDKIHHVFLHRNRLSSRKPIPCVSRMHPVEVKTIKRHESGASRGTAALSLEESGFGYGGMVI